MSQSVGDLNTPQEGFTQNGHWWLPENPEKRVAGFLTFTHGERFVLSLIGNLTPLIEENNGPLTIFGSLEGKKITLLQAFQSNASISWATYEHTQETFVCFGALIGICTTEGFNLKSNKLVFRTHLTESLLNGPSLDFVRNNGSVGMTLEIPTYETIEIDETTNLELYCQTRQETKDFAKKITIDMKWVLNSTQQLPISELISNFAHPFLLLSTFANNNEDYIYGLEATRVDQGVSQQILLYDFQYQKKVDLLRLRPHEQYFNLSDYAILAPILKNWYQLYFARKDTFDQFFVDKYLITQLSEDKYLRMIRVVETWENKEQTSVQPEIDSEFNDLVERLKSTFSCTEIDTLGGLPSGRDLLIEQINRFCSNFCPTLENLVKLWPEFSIRAKATRHALTHSVSKRKSFNGSELQMATTLFELIFEAKVMIKLGIPIQNIEAFLKYSNEYREVLNFVNGMDSEFES